MATCNSHRLIAAVALLLAATPAFADFKVVERTAFDFSQMTLMGMPVTSDQLDLIKQSPLLGGANGMDITIQESGDKMRCDAPGGSTIVDFKAKKEILLLPKTRQYMESDIPTSKIGDLTAGAASTVTDGKQTKTVLGHTTHLYLFTVSNSMLTFNGSAWMATDLPDLPPVALDGTNPAMGFIKSKVSGFPLEMNARIDMPSVFGALGLNYTVTSVSTDAIPASVFAIPDGYVKTDAPAPGALDPGLSTLPQTTPSSAKS
ncbi:MAG: hypothetical protein P4L33_16655 [Capsulimonadaceae bacterium]|nr:hypothetical protein [Capsulimonadaceae bacterium]